ncbi:hypothetical protein D1007_60466 [Hordeum vulgare]|nr:hypothetical protein D1007_60466 [Hordeum vulgare]
MQYSQELKEHLAPEKQIPAAHADEVATAAIRVDPEILEEYLTVEAFIDALRIDAATRLTALNDILWRFLEAIVGAFDKDYKVISECARAYLNSRAIRLVPGTSHGTHHYEEGTHNV